MEQDLMNFTREERRRMLAYLLATITADEVTFIGEKLNPDADAIYERQLVEMAKAAAMRRNDPSISNGTLGIKLT